jgi:hypothetical protein
MVYFTKWIRVRSGLCREVESGSGPKPDRVRSRAQSNIDFFNSEFQRLLTKAYLTKTFLGRSCLFSFFSILFFDSFLFTAFFHFCCHLLMKGLLVVLSVTRVKGTVS